MSGLPIIAIGALDRDLSVETRKIPFSTERDAWVRWLVYRRWRVVSVVVREVLQVYLSYSQAVSVVFVPSLCVVTCV